MCAWYTHQLNFGTASYLDLEGFHPNVSGSRIQNKKRALVYCSKEDPEPLQYNMDIKAETAAREGHHRIVGKRLLSEPLTEMVKEYPELIFGYKKLKMDLQEYKMDLEEVNPDPLKEIENPWGNAFEIHEGKRKHYWVWSRRPDKGKTTWLKLVAKKMTASWYNYTEVFQNIRNGSQFLMMDEFTRAHITA